MMSLDHIVIAAADLSLAQADFHQRTGCQPAYGGAHVGAGTHNALVSFGHGRYLEIIAPDPEQTQQPNSLGSRLTGETQLLAWAAGTRDMAQTQMQISQCGLTPSQPFAMSREQRDGPRLDWQLLRIEDGPAGGVTPFFIDWQACPHPAQTNPVVGELVSFQVWTEHKPLLALLNNIEGIEVKTGPDRLCLAFSSANGAVAYDTSDPLGFWA